MKRIILFCLIMSLVITGFSQSYFPLRRQWQHLSPAALGLDSDKLAAAIQQTDPLVTPAPIT